MNFKRQFSHFTSKLVLVLMLLMVSLSASCKTEEEKKLESLFADGKYPFTNILGEAPEIADFIL